MMWGTVMSKKQRARTDIPDALKSIDVKAVLRRRGVYLQQRENRRLKAAARPLAEALVKKHKAKKLKKNIEQVPLPQKYTSFSNSDAQVYWEKQINNIQTLEEHFDLAVKRFLTDKVLPVALGKLEHIIETNKSKKSQAKALLAFKKRDIFDDEEQVDLSNEAQINLEPLLQNMGVIAGQDANKLIGINAPYVPSSAFRAKVQANVERFTKSMLDTDQKHLTDLITNGIESGESIAEIRAEITKDFGDYSDMQAERITRTEISRAANQAALDSFVQSGVVEGQQWLTAGAEDECADFDGKVEALDGNFYPSTDEFTDGEPPLHPNCRCILIPVLISTGESSDLADVSEE